MALLRRAPAVIPPVPVSRPAQALTAAARRLDLTSRDALKVLGPQRPLAWQSKAWEWYDELGEVRFASGWIGDALSRLRIVPAWQDDPSQPPTILTDETLADVEGVTPEMLEAVQASIARLDQGPGHAELMRLSGIQATIPGEWYVIGRVDDDKGEVWEVHAVDAIERDEAARTRLVEYPGQSREESPLLDEDTVIIHLMRRHPRWVKMPDSPMRGALEYCEDLRILRDSVRGTAMSRMNAGIFGVPKEATFGTGEQNSDPEQADPETSGQTGDALTDALIAHMSTPIKDPRSASAVVPFLLRLYGEDLDKVQKWDFSRDIDRLAIELREEARRSLAGVMDLPAEIMLGMGDTNHWTAWQVTEDAFRIHIEPLGMMILAGLTDGYLRPLLDAQGIEPGGLMLWYDPTDLVSKPDEAKQVEGAYDRIEVSGSYYRQVLGIPEDAAPDDEELEHRKALAEIKAATKPAPPGFGGAPEGEADSGGMAPGTEAGPPDEAEEPEEIPAQTASVYIDEADLIDLDALIAAAKRDETWKNVAVRLGRMEIQVMDRLRVSADELLNRGLEKAGNRLRSLANKDKAGLARRAVQSVPAREVAMSLGPAMVAGLGATPDDLLSGAFDALRPRWDEWVSSSQREAFRLVRRQSRLTAAADEDFDVDDFEAEWEAWEEEHSLAEDRNEGWALLVAGLGLLAAAALFGRPGAGPQGETDGMAVPPGPVREALRRAGGTTGGLSLVPVPGVGVDATNFNGLLSGPAMADMFKALAGREMTGNYTWLYGDPGSRKTPFEPHYALDGVEFASFTDDVLANSDTWPDVDYYTPGDHPYCQCVAVRATAAGEETVDDVPEGQEELLIAASAFSDDQPREPDGRFGSKDGGDEKAEEGSLAERFAAGETGLVLPVDEVGTFIDQLATLTEKGQRYNLCEVEVPGTNLFCTENQGIPRQEMPQFKGEPGEKLGAAATVDKNGEVDVTQGFLDSLRGSGVGMSEETVPAYELKATQTELRGEKVAGMVEAAVAGKFAPTGEAIVGSKDNYVIDGHHRWAASAALDARDGRLGDDKAMPIIRVDMGVLDLVAAAKDYTEGRVLPKAG